MILDLLYVIAAVVFGILAMGGIELGIWIADWVRELERQREIPKRYISYPDRDEPVPYERRVS